MSMPSASIALPAPILQWVQALLCAIDQIAPPPANPDAAQDADVRAAAGGDGEAYARLIRRYQPLITRRMQRFTRRPADLEDLVHDTFVEAYFALPRYRGDAPLEHFLQRIATRVGYRFWKRQRRSPAPLPSDVAAHHDPGQAAVDQADEGCVVIAALEHLPPRDRLVLTLLYVEQRSVREAADLAGWSQVMVKVQAYRARSRFRKLLIAQGVGV